MRVNVRLIGYLAIHGLPSGFLGGPVDLPDDAQVVDLLRVIGLPLPTPYLITRGGQLANLEDRLNDGDALSLIPPIGGGSHWK